MLCRAPSYTFLMYGFYACLIVDIILHWNDYRSCYAPIQSFLLYTYILIGLQTTLYTIKSIQGLHEPIRKSISKFIYWILHPAFIYLTIQGMIWEQQNYKYSPHCIPQERLPFIVWCWIGLLIVMDTFFIFLTVTKIIKWWRIRMLQRRIRRLVDDLMTLNDQHLRQFLLASTGEDPNGITMDSTGLRSEDVDRIEDIIYNKEMIDIGKGNLDLCPICFEEFQEGIYIKALPVCRHIFHEKCIKEWLTRNPLCPMCRGNVRTNLRATTDDWDQEFDVMIDDGIVDLEANLLGARV